MTSQTKRATWRACIGGTMVLLAITYSPLVMRAGAVDPWLFGLPRTLWASVLSAFGIVVLTAIGATVRPTDDMADDNPERDSNQR